MTMSIAPKRRAFLFVVVVAVMALCVSSGWGKLFVAAVCGERLVLDYEKQLNVTWEDSEVVAELKVWNAGFSALEILGVSTPCPSCIDVEGLPASIPPFGYRVVKFRLPIQHLPMDQRVPLEFRLLCDRAAPNTEFEYSLYRKPHPDAGRVPTLAKPDESAQLPGFVLVEEREKS